MVTATENSWVDSIKTAWAFARPLIEPACQYGEYSIEMIERKVLNQKWQLWTGEKSACITEIYSSDLGRCMSMPYCGGDLDELIQNYDRMEEFARDMGCVQLFLMGRPGWLRVFKDKGFKAENIIGKRL